MRGWRVTERLEPKELVLAVDGGASKTDVWLLTADGAIVGSARGEGSNHQFSGLDAAMDAVGSAIGMTMVDAGFDGGVHPIAGFGVFCMAGLDLPVDEQRLTGAITSRGWAATATVLNDSLAVLRAGARSGWGVGVVCGSGLNCVGLGPDGSMVRFPSLGELSGDLAAGGSWLGVRALGLALRARDGRGGPTGLVESVAAHFDRIDPESVLAAVYTGEVAYGRLFELAQVCMEAAAAGDRVAAAAVEFLADEVVAMVTATSRRLGLTGQALEVVLGGGLFDGEYPGFGARIEAAVREVVPEALFRRLDAAPVLGAALLALDAVGASDGAKRRLRDSVPSTGSSQ
jgi:N-acetylglucosamine kinase-like BadF-type ATPase